MSKWVKKGIPTFAVVGRVNMGKSAVLATLLEVDDDRIIRVSATPGETTHCQVLPVEFEGRELARFIDTPGFSRPLEAMRAIQELHGEGTPDLEAVERFVTEQAEAGEFEDERRLLEPILEGAGLMYVIDPSRPLRDAFVAEMEILRWTGRPRLALLNQKAGDAEYLEDWKERLGSYFNLVRTFNAHHARFEERKSLMRSLLDIDESNRSMLEEAIGLIDEEWESRREEAADAILDMLRESLTLRVDGRLEEEVRRSDRKKEKLGRELAQSYLDQIRKSERRAYERLLDIYRHHLVEVEPGGRAYEGIDLEKKETWKKWGLKRWQLALAGGAAGAAMGAGVDVGTGGVTHGAGTVGGGLVLGTLAFLKGESLPDIQLDKLKGLKVTKGGRSLEIGPPKNPNFPWVLLDSALHHYLAISQRAHGLREEEVLAGSDGESLVREWGGKRRNLFTKWFVSCLKGAPNDGLDNELYEEMVAGLVELERRG